MAPHEKPQPLKILLGDNTNDTLVSNDLQSTNKIEKFKAKYFLFSIQIITKKDYLF